MIHELCHSWSVAIVPLICAVYATHPGLRQACWRVTEYHNRNDTAVDGSSQLTGDRPKAQPKQDQTYNIMMYDSQIMPFIVHGQLRRPHMRHPG